MRWLIAAGWMIAGVGIAAAQEPASTMQSEAEQLASVPAGPWQGNWRVVRDDARIRTRGGAELARLHIIQDDGDASALVQWVTGPAICEDPLAEPCEWVGHAGQAEHAAVAATGLYVLMPVSADASAPMLLHLTRPAEGAVGFAYDGFLRYDIILEREQD